MKLTSFLKVATWLLVFAGVAHPLAVGAEEVADVAYVSNLEITGITDGTAPWDTAAKVGSLLDPTTGGYQTPSSPGNDDGPSNGRIRTFDTITYDLRYDTAVYFAGTTLETAYLCYRFELPLSAAEAAWATDAMGWLQEEGFTITEEVVGGKTVQVLSGRRKLQGTQENPTAVPGSGTLNAFVKVLKMKNGDTFRPTFSLWVEGNCTDGICAEHNRDEVISASPSYDLTVTAAPKYNVRLNTAGPAFHGVSGTFDFDTGNATAFDYGRGKVKGRLAGIGVTLQLYNDYPDKKLMGIEMPKGPITVDVNLKTMFEPQSAAGVKTQNAFDVSTDYAPLVWAAGAHNGGNLTDHGGRDVGVNGNPTTYLHYAAPYNKYRSASYHVSCYNGGTWTATKSGNTVSFTVTDYEIDMDCFPVTDVDRADSNATFYTYDANSPDHGVKNIGCFSAGYILVVIPFENHETKEPVLDEFNTPSGTFYLDTTDVNLRASGQTLPLVAASAVTRPPQPPAGNANQMASTDDALHDSVALYKNGAFQTYIYYSDGEDQYRNVDINGRTDYHRTGEDYAMEGQRFSVHWQIINTENGDAPNRAYAFKALMKFDPAGMELDGTGSPSWTNKGKLSTYPASLRYLYAVKPDGSSWANDDEMQAARIENLRYYASQADIPPGYTCVAVLYEVDAIGSIYDLKEIVQGYHHVFFKAKEGAARDETYMICIEGRVWRVRDYPSSDPSGLSNVPSVAGMTTISLPPASATIARNYTKAYYNESGYAGGHSGNFNVGDSLLITKYRTGVSLSVEQTTSGGNPKQIFDMDYNQRTVDYILQPRLFTGLPVPVAGQYANVVTISCELPASLAYMEGSSFQGGTYVPDANPSLHGSVSGGTALEPTVTAGTDGARILTWTLYNVEVDQPVAPIHFSCEIGTPGVEETDVVNGQGIVNVAKIRASGDKSALSLNDGNVSEAGIQVSKLKASSLSKVANTPVLDPSDDLRFTLKVSNNGETPAPALMMDTLPYDGDSLGSHFSGGLDVTGLTIANFDSKASWSVYYTSSTAIRGYNASDISAADLANGQSVLGGETIDWTCLTYNTTTGVVTGFPEEDPDDIPTAIVLAGNLEPKETLSATLVLQASGKGPGDVFCNKLSSGSSTTSAKEFVISRTLEGVVWNDYDENGARDAGETPITGVTVTLMKLVGDEYVPVLDGDGNPVTCEVGKVRNIATGEETDGEAGHYRFTGLEAGTYGVRIESGEGDGALDISNYIVTGYKTQGVPEQINNDATGTYDATGTTLSRADIAGIEMPTKEQLTQTRQSQYVASGDAGLYAKTYTVTYHVAGDPTYGTPAGGTAPSPTKKIVPGTNVDLADMPVTLITGALDPVGQQEMIPGKWTLGEHWSTDSGADESGYIVSDELENVSGNIDVYAQWVFTPQEVALWIVDHEERDNGRCYLAFEPQFKVEEGMRDWIRRTRENSQVFVKYGRTWQECDACAPVQAYARDHRSEVGTPTYADCDPGERDVAKGWMWIQVDLPPGTVAPIGYWRVYIEQRAMPFIYGGRAKTVYVDDATGEPIPDVDPDRCSRPTGALYTARPKTIPGYICVAVPPETTGTIETDKELAFTYRYAKATSYTVRCLEVGTDHELLDTQFVPDQRVGDTVWESAPDIDGFQLVTDYWQIIELQEDANFNEIVFYYEPFMPPLFSYTVRYVDHVTYKPLIEDKPVDGIQFGTIVHEEAPPIKGYEPIYYDTLDWVVEEDGIVKIFVYREVKPELN